jgi:hypothetical protein
LGWLENMVVLAKENSIEAILMTPLLVDARLAESQWFPDVDYNFINGKLEELRRLMLEYGQKNGVRIIDAQGFYAQLYTDETVSEYLLDGLHPTAAGQGTSSKRAGTDGQEGDNGRFGLYGRDSILSWCLRTGSGYYRK